MCFLLLIKYYTIKRAYKNKLDTFIHPITILDDISIKIKYSDNDPRMILGVNINRVKDDPECLRNLAIMMGYM